MWVKLSDSELRQQSALIVEGEWAGVSAWPGRQDGARLGQLVVHQVWQGSPTGKTVRVAQAAATAPASSSELRFRAGDRRLWFLQAAPGTDAAGVVYVIDHPQRFLRDVPGNAAALQAWRERLAR